MRSSLIVRASLPEEPGGRDQAADAPATAPDVEKVCPATFGNSDIYGFTSVP
jgi:hypothetical protein